MKKENICSNCGHKKKYHSKKTTITVTDRKEGWCLLYSCPCKKFQNQSQEAVTSGKEALNETSILSPRGSIGSKPEDVVAGGFENRGSDNYPTPKWLMDLFEGFYDPCPLQGRLEGNGLLMEWGNKTYVNPPYSNPAPWVKKAIEESNKGKKVIMLLPVDSSTQWFRDLLEADAHIFYHHGRLSFNREPLRFASMLVIL